MSIVCRNCLEEKEDIDFYKGNKKCKKCKIEYGKKYVEENRDKIKAYKREYSLNNKESIREYHSSKYQSNKDFFLKTAKDNYKKNRDKKIAYQKEYAFNNKESRNLYSKNRKKYDNLFRISCSVKNMIYNSLKRKGYSKRSNTYLILGCTYEFLMGYIEGKFEEWMTWENYGLYNGELNYGWDIDHIIPLSSALSEEDVIKLNHYSNLQPLCAKINRDIKRDKLLY